MGDAIQGLAGIAVWWTGATGVLLFGLPHSNAGLDTFAVTVVVLLWSAVIGLSILSSRKHRTLASASEQKA